MKELLNRFIREQEGQDLVEYALLMTLVAAALVTAIGLLTTAIGGQFTRVTNLLT